MAKTGGHLWATGSEGAEWGTVGAEPTVSAQPEVRMWGCVDIRTDPGGAGVEAVPGRRLRSMQKSLNFYFQGNNELLVNFRG